MTPALTALLLRPILVLYLLASALARFDRGPINRLEMALRLLAAVLVLWKTAPVMWVGLGLAAVLIGSHYLLSKRKHDDAAPA